MEEEVGKSEGQGETKGEEDSGEQGRPLRMKRWGKVRKREREIVFS